MVTSEITYSNVCNKEHVKMMKTSLPKEQLRRRLGCYATELGWGGVSKVAEAYGVSRWFVSKGCEEYTTGIAYAPLTSNRGCKKTKDILAKNGHDILKDMIDMFEANSSTSTDPQFRNNFKYLNMSAPDIHDGLLLLGYKEDEIPSLSWIGATLKQLGYVIKFVQKTIPLKRIPEVNEIMGNVAIQREIAMLNEKAALISIDCKAKVTVCRLSRGGKSRKGTKALDHDYKSESDHVLEPMGILDLKTGETEIKFVYEKATSDAMVDFIQDWAARHFQYDTIYILSDNGPENSSARTQYINRMLELSDELNLCVKLVYYPPYFSKYNPVERVWAAVEMYWGGSILDTDEAVLGYASHCRYNGMHPTVSLTTKSYPKGISLESVVMAEYRKYIDVEPGIEPWFLSITPENARKALKEGALALARLEDKRKQRAEKKVANAEAKAAREAAKAAKAEAKATKAADKAAAKKAKAAKVGAKALVPSVED